MQASGASREEVLEAVLDEYPDLKIVGCERIDLSDIPLRKPAPTNVWAVAFEDPDPDEFIQDIDPIGKVRNEARHFYESLAEDPDRLPTAVIEGPFVCPACSEAVDLQLPPDRVQRRMPEGAPIYSRCPECGRKLIRLKGDVLDNWQVAVTPPIAERLEPEPPGQGLGIRRACIFCGGEDQKISKEHLWSKWLREHFGPSGGTTRRIHGAPNRKITSRSEWPSTGLDREISGPCKRCNESWMADLENQAAPLLIPMLRGEEMELRPQEQRIVALWTTLKVLVAQKGLGADVKRVIPRDRYRLFYADRLLPTGAEIWLGHYDGSGPWPTSYLYKELFITPQGQDETSLPNAYLVGFTIGHLAFFFWGHEFRYGLGADVQQVESYLTQIWPATGVAKWPPSRLMEADGLHFVMERFPIQGWL